MLPSAILKRWRFENPAFRRLIDDRDQNQNGDYSNERPLAVAIHRELLRDNKRFALAANAPALNGVRESGVFAWTPSPPFSLVSTGDLGIASEEDP